MSRRVPSPPPRRSVPPLSTSLAVTQRCPLRVGVLGCAKVLFKSWPAIHSAGHKVTFIGCRDVARAKVTAKEILASIDAAAAAAAGGHETRNAAGWPRFGAYEDVVHAPDVDVVYIAIPVALRDEWVRACIENGKHVVGEKPAAVSATQLLSWLDGCAWRRLLYMDGTMLTHSDRMRLVREKVRSLGTLKRVEANFSFLGSESFLAEDIRCQTHLEPHGALGDLGWYAIRWILHMVDFAVPVQVSGSITSVSGGGAISGFEGHLSFALSPSPSHTPPAVPVTARFFCSFLAAYQQCVRVFTSGGLIEVQGAINPTGEDRPHFLLRTTTTTTPASGRQRPVVKVEKVYSTAAEVDGSQQAVELWRSVGGSLLRLGAGEPLLMDPEKGKDWGRNAYLTQLVMDKLLESATAVAPP